MTQLHTDALALRKLLDGPAKWTKGAFARNEDGGPSLPESPHAMCWCIRSAMMRVTQNAERFEALTIAATNILGACSLAFWNDVTERTWADIDNLIDEMVRVSE